MNDVEFEQKTGIIIIIFFCCSVNIKSVDVLILLPDQYNGNNNILELFLQLKFLRSFKD